MFFIVIYLQFSYSLIIPVEIIKKGGNDKFKIGETKFSEVVVKNYGPTITIKADNGQEVKVLLDSGTDSSYLVATNVQCFNDVCLYNSSTN